jgi:hypothetical protein
MKLLTLFVLTSLIFSNCFLDKSSNETNYSGDWIGEACHCNLYISCQNFKLNISKKGDSYHGTWYGNYYEATNTSLDTTYLEEISIKNNTIKFNADVSFQSGTINFVYELDIINNDSLSGKRNDPSDSTNCWSINAGRR